MKRIIIESMRNAVRHWYLISIVGFIFLLVNVLTLYGSEETLGELSIIFGVSYLICGVLEIVFALINRTEISIWILHLSYGIAITISGLSLVINSNISVKHLVYSIGIMILIRSIGKISFALNIKNLGSANWLFMMLLGLIGLSSSYLLIYSSSLEFETILPIIGFNMFLSGLFSIYFSLQLRDLHKLSLEPPIDLSEGLSDLSDEMLEDFEKNK